MVESLYAVFFLILLITNNASGLFKASSLTCKIEDESVAEPFAACRIYALSRTATTFVIRTSLKKPVTKCKLRLAFRKRENGWRPFLYDVTIEVCDFMRHRKRYLLVDTVYQFLEKYVSFNHTCPYKIGEEIRVEGFKFDEKGFLGKFPLDVGEYGVVTMWYFSNKLIATVNGSLTYSDYRKLH